MSVLRTILREKNGGFAAERGGNERENYNNILHRILLEII
jgi:hypothetical protein